MRATSSFLAPLFRGTSRTCGRFRTTSPCLSRRCATDFGLATATRFRRSCAARTARFTAFALTAGLHRRTPRSLSLLARCGYFLAPTGGAFRFRTRTARIAQTEAQLQEAQAENRALQHKLASAYGKTSRTVPGGGLLKELGRRIRRGIPN